jgi:proteasome accessory factor B
VARVRVRQGAGHGLRRHADEAGTAADGWQLLDVRYGGTGAFVDELLGYGADVVVEEPVEVRDAVVGALREAAGAS